MRLPCFGILLATSAKKDKSSSMPTIGLSIKINSKWMRERYNKSISAPSKYFSYATNVSSSCISSTASVSESHSYQKPRSPIIWKTPPPISARKRASGSRTSFKDGSSMRVPRTAARVRSRSLTKPIASIMICSKSSSISTSRSARIVSTTKRTPTPPKTTRPMRSSNRNCHTNNAVRLRFFSLFGSAWLVRVAHFFIRQLFCI